MTSRASPKGPSPAASLPRARGLTAGRRAAAPQLQPHPSPGRSVADGVIQDVQDGPPEPVWIPDHDKVGVPRGAHLQPDAPHLSQGPHDPARFQGDVGQAHGNPPERHLGVVQPGQSQEPFHRVRRSI